MQSVVADRAFSGSVGSDGAEVEASIRPLCERWRPKSDQHVKGIGLHVRAPYCNRRCSTRHGTPLVSASYGIARTRCRDLDTG